MRVVHKLEIERSVLSIVETQAIDCRDALAKAIYANLFDWLVDRINKSLHSGKWRSGRTISILDIYGFESFKVSFLTPKINSLKFGMGLANLST
jgi:myosin heavy subunit